MQKEVTIYILYSYNYGSYISEKGRIIDAIVINNPSGNRNHLVKNQTKGNGHSQSTELSIDEFYSDGYWLCHALKTTMPEPSDTVTLRFNYSSADDRYFSEV